MILPINDVLRFLLGSGLGLIIGSFLGALVMRWPNGLSVMRGRSACDACGRTLAPYELIPLISALVLRGGCRSCGAQIDRIHMFMELGAALIGGLAFWLLPLPLALLFAAACWMLLTLAVLDARHFWLPDLLTLPLAALGLTFGDLVLPAPFWDRVIGAAVGYGSLFLLAFVYRRLRGRDGLGLGDAKLLGALGAWLGWQLLPMLVLFASLGGLIWLLVLRLRGQHVGHTTRLPFGTFLGLAVLPAIALGWSLGL